MRRISPHIDGSEDEISTIRDSVLNEPAMTGKLQQAELGQWLAEKRGQCTLGGNVAVTLVAALIAGPFAIMGAFVSGRQTFFAAVYMVLFAPVIEELLKQSGMVYLLEKKPYRIFSAGQFVIAAMVSALIFSAVENLLYINLYADLTAMTDPMAYVAFRWKYCTLLHVTCSVIASFGLIRVWKKQCLDNREANLAEGFWYFAAAMGIHGTFNFIVMLIAPKF
ncbi:MAG: PrsW family intramembrane metalloprotease [Planctomycetes bacterium]|nr:PrsW family intramembrane metalloprotease [Planctomycetota bacterium]